MTGGMIRKLSLAACLALSLFLMGTAAQPALAEDMQIASSAQVYEVLKGRILQAFSEKEGIQTHLTISSSERAVRLLALGSVQVATTAEPLTPQDLAYGLVARPFCQDSLAVIVHPQTKPQALTSQLLAGIFTGAITNWSQLGGSDAQIKVILPSPETAAYRAFVRMVLQGRLPVYDLMTFQSTGVVEAVRKYKNSIGFVNLTAAHNHPEGVRVLPIEGLEPTAPNYPFREVFSLVTTTKPNSAAARLVEFVFSPEGRKIITDQGLIALPE